MLAILAIVTPVFILIAIGYASVKTGLLGAEISDHLSAFAIKLAVPILLFRAMSELDLASAFSWPLLTSFYAGVVTCFVTGIVLALYIFKKRPGESVAFGFTAAFSNSVLLGIPILQNGYSGETLNSAFGIIALHAPFLYTMGMTTMEMMRRDGKPLGQTLKIAIKSIAKNALMIGIAAGLIVNLSGLEMIEAIKTPLDMLAKSAIPAALVGIGAALTRYKVSAALPETLTVAGLSLFLQPVIVFILGYYVFTLPKAALQAAIILSAMPPGVNVYIFASMYQRGAAIAASALLVSTTIAIASISIWLLLLEVLLP